VTDLRRLRQEEIRDRAAIILAALDKKRGPEHGAFVLAAWTRMWDLMEQAYLEGFTFEPTTLRTWSYVETGDGSGATRRVLASDQFELPVPWPHARQLRLELPEFLNWAGVAEPKRS
jgi:hypothetical protein